MILSRLVDSHKFNIYYKSKKKCNKNKTENVTRRPGKLARSVLVISAISEFRYHPTSRDAPNYFMV